METEDTMTYIAEDLNRAKFVRLSRLLSTRYPSKVVASFGSLEDETAEDLYNSLSIVASFHVSHWKRQGASWKQIEKAMREASKGTGTIRCSPAVHQALKRASRAMRLIDRLITVGVISRGEV